MNNENKENQQVEEVEGTAGPNNKTIDWESKFKELESSFNTLKTSFDKASSETAKYKKMYKEKLTDEEKNEQSMQEQLKELETLRNDKKKATIVTSLLSKGMSQENASKIADSVLGGDVDLITEAISGSLDGVVASLKQEIDELKRNSFSDPNGGAQQHNESSQKSYKDMSLDERIALKQSNPELFEKLKNQ